MPRDHRDNGNLPDWDMGAAVSLTDHQIIELAKQYGYSTIDFYGMCRPVMTEDGSSITWKRPTEIHSTGRKLIDLARAAYEANSRE